MKNSIYFDETFTPELLVNEESDPALRNSVWLIFSTGSGSNPKLEITVRTVAYTVNLTENTDYNYQLPGLYWAAGGVTSIRLVSGAGASEYIYITFPEIISGDAALCEEELQDHAYFMQGKEDQAAELRTETIKYVNGRDYYIMRLQQIIAFVFASRNANASALLTCTICFTASGITDETDVNIRIKVNHIFDESFLPSQTIRNGKHIITICYPVTNIGMNDRNEVDVYIETGEGVLEILQGNALATLTASGLATSSGFGGEIELLDYVENFAADTAMIFMPAGEALTISQLIPIGPTITENVAVITMPGIAVIDNFVETVRVVNYELARQRVLEDEATDRVTEDGANYRYTESEHG